MLLADGLDERLRGHPLLLGLEHDRRAVPVVGAYVRAAMAEPRAGTVPRCRSGRTRPDARCGWGRSRRAARSSPGACGSMKTWKRYRCVAGGRMSAYVSIVARGRGHVVSFRQAAGRSSRFRSWTAGRTNAAARSQVDVRSEKRSSRRLGMIGNPNRLLQKFLELQSVARVVWRWGWDSNPRSLAARWFSRPELSTTQPPHRARRLQTGGDRLRSRLGQSSGSKHIAGAQRLEARHRHTRIHRSGTTA